MRPEADGRKFRRVRRSVNSNGGDVYPTVCSTQSKGVQNQMDNGGYYILSFFKRKNDRGPLTSALNK